MRTESSFNVLQEASILVDSLVHGQPTAAQEELRHELQQQRLLLLSSQEGYNLLLDLKRKQNMIVFVTDPERQAESKQIDPASVEIVLAEEATWGHVQIATKASSIQSAVPLACIIQGVLYPSRLPDVTVEANDHAFYTSVVGSSKKFIIDGTKMLKSAFPSSHQDLMQLMKTATERSLNMHAPLPVRVLTMPPSPMFH